MCSDFLGDSAVWVYAFLPVWLASPGCVVVCTLVPWGPPDVSVCESGETFGRTGPGLCFASLLSLGCGPPSPGFLYLKFLLFPRQIKLLVPSPTP